MPGQQRVLPSQASLRYLKVEAKRRLAAGEFPALHLAQLAIAREHGQPGWPALKRLVADRSRPEGHVLAQLRWIVSRFAGADAPGWTPPGEAELREHFTGEFLTARREDLITMLAAAAPVLREEPTVIIDLPCFARIRLGGFMVMATAGTAPPHPLSSLLVQRGGSQVSDPRVASPPADTVGDVPPHVARIAAAAIAELGLVGLALAGGEPGRTWSAATGRADLDRAEALSVTHRFPAYDITKVITAVTVLRLVADGHVRLDDPAGRHLRTVRLADDAVTVRDLLGHTSGVADLPEAFAPRAAEDLVTLTGPVADCTGDRGTFRAGHAGYAVLGQLIADATGLPYPEAAARLVLRPLGMSRSGFPARWPRAGAVTGYELWPDGLFDPVPRTVCVSHAAGGLWTTAGDLTRFGLGWSSLLPRELAAEALAPQAATAVGAHAGLGWVVNPALQLAGYHGLGPAGAASLLVPLAGGRASAALTSRPVLIEPVNAEALSAAFATAR